MMNMPKHLCCNLGENRMHTPRRATPRVPRLRDNQVRTRCGGIFHLVATATLSLLLISSGGNQTDHFGGRKLLTAGPNPKEDLGDEKVPGDATSASASEHSPVPEVTTERCPKPVPTPEDLGDEKEEPPKKEVKEIRAKKAVERVQPVQSKVPKKKEVQQQQGKSAQQRSAQQQRVSTKPAGSSEDLGDEKEPEEPEKPAPAAEKPPTTCTAATAQPKRQEPQSPSPSHDGPPKRKRGGLLDPLEVPPSPATAQPKSPPSSSPSSPAPGPNSPLERLAKESLSAATQPEPGKGNSPEGLLDFKLYKDHWNPLGDGSPALADAKPPQGFGYWVGDRVYVDGDAKPPQAAASPQFGFGYWVGDRVYVDGDESTVWYVSKVLKLQGKLRVGRPIGADKITKDVLPKRLTPAKHIAPRYAQYPYKVGDRVYVNGDESTVWYVKTLTPSWKVCLKGEDPVTVRPEQLALAESEPMDPKDQVQIKDTCYVADPSLS